MPATIVSSCPRVSTTGGASWDLSVLPSREGLCVSGVPSGPPPADSMGGEHKRTAYMMYFMTVGVVSCMTHLLIRYVNGKSIKLSF
jgi:hypothetical protein